MLTVLWVTNAPTSRIADHLGICGRETTGWLTGYADALADRSDLRLTIAFPLLDGKERVTGEIDGIRYASFHQGKLCGMLSVPVNRVTTLARRHLQQAIDETNPLVLHVFGTEYEHSLVAAKLFGRPSRTLVHIQGLISAIADHYCSGLDPGVLTRFALSNIVRGNILRQKKQFQVRGAMERELLRYVENVSGRTEWDEACVKLINRNIEYYLCNECLRQEFYCHSWEFSECEKHSLFISQASYPIKGFHFVIAALPRIVECFPDAHLYVAGNDFTNTRGLRSKLKISSYGLHIKDLIRRNKLEDRVTFTGFLNAKQMCQRYLKANVFVSASTIENSPNSLGEAMILGVPSVASDVGGVRSMFTHGADGFTYQYDDPNMLAHYVCRIFDDPGLATRLSRNARLHALSTHDKKRNAKTLMTIYRAIAAKN